MTVVPTAQIFLLFLSALFITLTESSLIFNSSESILCFDRSSTSTGLKVPSPICNVISGRSTPFISSFLSKCFEKCNPAVGAATAPSFFA